MAPTLTYFVCKSCFGDLESPIYCNSCSQPAHNKCTGLSVTEIKCLSLKNKDLIYFCISCDRGLKVLPDLKLLLKKFLTEVENLKVKFQTTDMTKLSTIIL